MGLATIDRRTFLAAGCVLPAAGWALCAQSSGVESGFVPLFDGETLGGWSVQDGPPSAFRVADGAIVVDQGSNFPTWLRSDRQYENFDFRCEIEIIRRTDSPYAGMDLDTGSLRPPKGLRAVPTESGIAVAVRVLF